jgi:SAM-dependent methyltransferase
MPPAMRLLIFLDELYRQGCAHDAEQTDRLARWRNIEPDTARLLAVLVRALAPRRLLELGTSNGYSTIWLADAARAVGGFLTSVELDPGRSAAARENLMRAGLAEAVELRVEDAAATLAGAPVDAWDFVLLDAERPFYAGYWPDLVRTLFPRRPLGRRQHHLAHGRARGVSRAGHVRPAGDGGALSRRCRAAPRRPRRPGIGVPPREQRRADTVRASYDAVAGAYVTHCLHELEGKPVDRSLLDEVAARADGLVCDLGCGPGHVARYLHERGADVFGVDLSPRMIEEAQHHHPSLRFEVGDMRALRFADGSLGAVVAMYSLIHFDDTDLLRAMQDGVFSSRTASCSRRSTAAPRSCTTTSCWAARLSSISVSSSRRT